MISKKQESIFQFQNETGAILDQHGRILQIVNGSAGAVEFPEETIWEFHKMSPGSIFALSHVHPPKMTELSHRDETTLRTWARAMYPFPFRIITIAETQRFTAYDPLITFQETVYLGTWESKEVWITRGKDTPREYFYVKEKETLFNFPQDQKTGWYGEILIPKSYGL